MPGVVATVSSETFARLSKAAMKPPLDFSTATMMVAMPPSMMMP